MRISRPVRIATDNVPQALQKGLKASQSTTTQTNLPSLWTDHPLLNDLKTIGLAHELENVQRGLEPNDTPRHQL